MIRLLLVLTMISAICVGCIQITRKQADAAQDTAGSISRAFGLPNFVGESIAAVIIGLTCTVTGHKNGRRVERKCTRPHVTKPAPLPHANERLPE